MKKISFITFLFFQTITLNLFSQQFTEQTGISLTGVSQGSVAWGDYDNDGYLDVLLSGWSDSGPVTSIYKNNGYNTFTEQTGISLTGVFLSSLAGFLLMQYLRSIVMIMVVLQRLYPDYLVFILVQLHGAIMIMTVIWIFYLQDYHQQQNVFRRFITTTVTVALLSNQVLHLQVYAMDLQPGEIMIMMVISTS
jgi:hypothetical protein